jgi:hypothetical protein
MRTRRPFRTDPQNAGHDADELMNFTRHHPQVSDAVLPGVVRSDRGTYCTIEEIIEADEIIVSSSLTLFSCVIQIDRKAVGGHDLSLYQEFNNAYNDRFIRKRRANG